MLKKIQQRYRYSLILIKEFVKSDHRVRYQDSILGYLWAPLKPLFLFIITWAVFTKGLNMGKGIPYWSVSLLIGTVFWTFFTEITSNSLGAITGSAELLKKINFPKYILVISQSITAIINAVFNLITVFILALIFHIHWKPDLLLLFLLMLELYIFAVGIGFILSTVTVYFRDLNNIWDIFIQTYMYVSIIIFPITTVVQHSVTLAKFALLNPMAQIIQDMRYLISGTDTVWKLWDHNYLIAGIPVYISVLTFVLGALYFRKKAPLFAEDV